MYRWEQHNIYTWLCPDKRKFFNSFVFVIRMIFPLSGDNTAGSCARKSIIKSICSPPPPTPRETSFSYSQRSHKGGNRNVSPVPCREISATVAQMCSTRVFAPSFGVHIYVIFSACTTSRSTDIFILHDVLYIFILKRKKNTQDSDLYCEDVSSFSSPNALKMSSYSGTLLCGHVSKT